MSTEFCLALTGIVILPWLAITPLLVLTFFLVLLPRPVTRQIRHRLADGVLWQWVMTSKISSKAHGWLWQKGNGDGDN